MADTGRYHAFSNRGIEVKLASVSLFDWGSFLRSLIAASKSSSHQFLCLTGGRFFVPTGIPPAPRGAAVNDGRRPPAQPAPASLTAGGTGRASREGGLAR